MKDDKTNDRLMEVDMKEVKLSAIQRDIVMSLENCTCLGKDAYGEYIERLTDSLMDNIRKI
jgi:mRNA-degrading endonuclease toxin of MazEF toxin-antitoxin module